MRYINVSNFKTFVSKFETFSLQCSTLKPTKNLKNYKNIIKFLLDICTPTSRQGEACTNDCSCLQNVGLICLNGLCQCNASNE